MDVPGNGNSPPDYVAAADTKTRPLPMHGPLAAMSARDMYVMTYRG